jgi:hypothetical protein
MIAFHGKVVYEKFMGRPCKLGLQKDVLYGARVFVLPSVSVDNGEAAAVRGVNMRYYKKLAILLDELDD